MLADLVVLGGDPLSDIGAVRDTRIVVADGRVHRMEALLTRPATDR
jgi:imidazolonepropionase-like amidohydrolase